MIEELDQTEPQPNEYGLIPHENGWVDPETGEVLSTTVNPNEIAFRYLSLDGQIAHAKERAAYWRKRAASLEKRRDWYDSLWLETLVKAAEKFRRGAVAEIGQCVIRWTKTRGSIEVGGRRDQQDAAVAWCRLACPEAIETREEVKASLLSDEARRYVFNTADPVSIGFAKVKAPGEYPAVVTGAGKS